ncbi:MAG: helix-turn-helix domain-containing protein, partial [Aliifodinibius sp.]|nr:AraC family transcriptional regulator [Fodinibius sp.]NIW44258.1 helix-turn-helix domain-containing protein [Gammaproteobacteria bacterium]NIY24675.1 helix-turn-helix domain-containing protein [Fodinibius sp.]
GEKVSRQHPEAMTTSLRRLIHGLTAENVQPAAVEFRHHQPEDTQEHQRIFDCPLRFDQPSNRLVLNTADLDYKIFLAKPAKLKEFEQIAQELVNRLYTADTWGKRAARILSQLLINGAKVNLEKVASELSISKRNLQSRLHEENTSYREILEELRKELALRYLARSDVSIYEVAFLLGYSEQNPFTRAFKRWTELHPAQYQQESLLD